MLLAANFVDTYRRTVNRLNRPIAIEVISRTNYKINELI